MGPVKGGGTQVADLSRGKMKGKFPKIFGPPFGKSYTNIWILTGGYRGLGGVSPCTPIQDPDCCIGFSTLVIRGGARLLSSGVYRTY